MTARRFDPARSRWPWLLLAAVLAGALAVGVVGDRGPSTPAERSRALGQSIKCPTCQGQSVGDSNASAAQAIRTEINRRITAGETDGQIRDYFASRYGDDILLTPTRDGLNGLVWFLPVAAFVAAIGGLAIVFRRWQQPVETAVSDEDRTLVDRARFARARSDRAG